MMPDAFPQLSEKHSLKYSLVCFNYRRFAALASILYIVSLISSGSEY